MMLYPLDTRPIPAATVAPRGCSMARPLPTKATKLSQVRHGLVLTRLDDLVSVAVYRKTQRKKMQLGSVTPICRAQMFGLLLKTASA